MPLDLITILKNRQESFDITTQEILAGITPVLDGIVTFFDMTEQFKAGQVKWKEIYAAKNPDYDEGLIIIVGRIMYNVDDLFKLPNGQTIPVTPDNQEHLNRIFRVGIPISIVQKKSQKETIEFLTKVEDIKKSKLDSEENNEIKHNQLDDFDMDKLTASQRESYLMFLSTTKKQHE